MHKYYYVRLDSFHCDQARSAGPFGSGVDTLYAFLAVRGVGLHPQETNRVGGFLGNFGNNSGLNPAPDAIWSLHIIVNDPAALIKFHFQIVNCGNKSQHDALSHLDAAARDSCSYEPNDPHYPIESAASDYFSDSIIAGGGWFESAAQDTIKAAWDYFASEGCDGYVAWDVMAARGAGIDKYTTLSGEYIVPNRGYIGALIHLWVVGKSLGTLSPGL